MSANLSVGQTVICGLGANFQTGKIVAISQDGKTAFVEISPNLLTGKPRFITVSVQKIKEVES